MPKAYWSGQLIAESDACVVVEGNQYFPVEAVKKEFLRPSSHTTVCPWKGTAHYYHIEVDGMKNEVAAWIAPIGVNPDFVMYSNSTAIGSVHGIPPMSVPNTVLTPAFAAL